jgi:glycine cleavage system H protein
VNEVLESSPESVNSDPYGEGWMVRLEPGEVADLSGLMDAAAYAEIVG